jgi:transposase
MDAPVGAEGQPLVPPEVWATFPPAAQAVIVALAAELAAERAARVALEARVRDLEARLGQDSANSSRPPSSDPPWARGGKRRPPSGPSSRGPGGQPGHPGRFRALAPPERVDAVVDHWPERCAGCAVPLAGAAGAPDYVPHQVTELPVLRATVTEHRLHRVACGACGATTRATLPSEVPTGAYGPRLQAAVATLSGGYRLSRRAVVDLCETLLDAPLSVGSVDALCQATSEALAPPVAEAVATLPAAAVVHADETPWKQGQERPWLWVAVTALVSVFRIARGRDSGVIKALIGATFRGTLVTDRFSAYAWLDVAYRQVCWAHLRRDLQALVDRGGPAAPLGRDALALVHHLFTAWHQFRAGALPRAALQDALAPVQEALAARLHAGQDDPDPQAAGLCRALLRLWPALWTFAEVEGVEPTNNTAERALRPAVLWRKGSFGTRSEGGARFVERLLTATATCRQQGRSVLAYLTDVCTAAQYGLPVPSLLPAAA